MNLKLKHLYSKIFDQVDIIIFVINHTGAINKEPTCQCRRQNEMQTRIQGQEGPLGQEMAIYFSILVRRILQSEEPGRLQSISSNSQTQLKIYDLIIYLFLEQKKQKTKHNSQTSEQINSIDLSRIVRFGAQSYDFFEYTYFF